jgi:hypothetical protein
MNIRIYQVVFSILVILSCERKPSEKILTYNTKNFIDLVDTISIDIDGEMLGKYERWTISDDNYFVGFNHLLYRIDVFSLEKMSFSHSIQLNKRGPNGLSSVGDVLKIGNEYIIIGGTRFYRVSDNGMVITKAVFKDSKLSKEGYILEMKGPRIYNFRDISLDAERKCIYKNIYKYQEDGNIDFSSFFICTINLAEWTIDPIKLLYPRRYVDSWPETGFLGEGYILRNGDLFIYNFPGGNEVYSYNTQTQKQKVHEPTILNHNDMKIALSDYGNDDSRSNLDAQVLSPRFLGVKYHNQSNTYYRIHKTKAKGENMFDADYFLIKMDRNFNTLAQFDLGKKFSPIFQINAGYLYFAPRTVGNDALYTLKLYRLKG